MAESKEQFIRRRITELRMEKDVAEHKMSLELGKSGSYIHSITSGKAMPSMREFFNILEYLEVTPATFFATLEEDASVYVRLCERLRKMTAEDLEKVATLVDWLEE